MNREFPQDPPPAAPTAVQPAPVSQPDPVQTAAAPEPAPVEPTPQPQAPQPQPQKIAAAAPAVPSAPKEGQFQLTTSPAGATATFDTSGIVCTTPCNLTLPAGRHTFVLRHTGYRDTQKIIGIPNDTGLIVDLVALSGTLHVNTDPPGLVVIIDGREQPQKTPLNVELPVGPHKVQVVKGSERQELQVDLSDGQFISKTISWQ